VVRERSKRTLTAFDVACRWLARAPRSEGEVRARLSGLGFSDRAVDDALNALRTRRYVDDEELGRARARTLAERGYGDAWIVQDLGRRGLVDDVVERSLAPLAPESERAREWLGRRSRGRADQEAGADVDVWRLLLQRGFTEDTVESVVGTIDDGG
jgi:regulatory protein